MCIYLIADRNILPCVCVCAIFVVMSFHRNECGGARGMEDSTHSLIPTITGVGVRGTGHDESGNGKIMQLDSYSITHPSLITIIRHSYHTIKTSPTISRDLIKNNKNPASILNTEDTMTGIPSRGSL